ncbi:MAG: gliding motility-associated C-terminal domain-containing protein [Bacteroidales bacterium]|nr:gliding motility-associated C-terminal domain-containing protein [Bacteroidales bacterium]
MDKFYNFGKLVIPASVLLFSMLLSSASFGQIICNTGASPEDMVENIVGEGIVYSNVVYTGANIARGIFGNGGTTNIGLNSGIFLTSGSASNIPGPNTSGSATANNGMAGDPQLTALASQQTYDASVLEFDFIPESDTLRFRYVFGSEEYPEWVLNLFNDVFGYFVTGPNPEGGLYVNKNVALVPGTQLPVAIATINNVIPSYPEYYVDNTGGISIQYDGFTVVLTAWLLVVPCEEYHIKMAVGDAGDHIYDSGVFIEENSFTSPKIEVTTELIPSGVGNYMVEGCVEADITFKIPASGWAPYTVHYEIFGTATNGVDYEELVDSVYIPAGTDTASIHVVPYYDGIPEGDETIVLVIENTLGCTTKYDTVEIIILDYTDMMTATSGNTQICEGQEVTIWATAIQGIPPYFYDWLGTGLTEDSITVSPPSTTMYYVEITDMCGGIATDSIEVVVHPAPTTFLGPDTTMCYGDELILHAGGGYLGYEWQNGSQDSTFKVTQPGTYWVHIQSTGGCTGGDTIVVNFFPPIQLDIGNGSNLINICEGDTALLNAGSGFVSYLWQDFSSDTAYLATTQGWYWVNVEDIYGCDATDSVYVQVDAQPFVYLGNDTVICSGNQLTLDAGAGFLSYVWQGTIQGSQFYTVSQPGNYCVEVTNNCGETSDCIQIGFYPEPVVTLGNDTTICAGTSLTLNAGSGFVNYNWMDGWSLQYYDVASSGLYAVEVTDVYGCSGSDEISVAVSNPQVNLGPDTLFCEGETVLLDAGSGFLTYIWQDGSSSQTFTVDTGGYYSVTVIDQYTCQAGSDITLEYFLQPKAALEDYAELCNGDTLTLSGPEGDYTYYWNGVSGPSWYKVSASGVYILDVENVCGVATDQIEVDVFPIPEVFLGEDDIRYPGEPYQIDAGQGFTEYTWHDGSFDRYFTITDENHTEDNYYFVEVYDGHCKNSDTIFIEEFKIEIPNIFTPNGDGKNDEFQPKELSGIEDFKIVIFNRWGAVVHEMTSMNDPWDGKSNGIECSNGVYFWVFECTFGAQNLKKNLKGSVTLLRD